MPMAEAKGFTLLELVLALIITVILAVVAVPQLLDTTALDRRLARDETLAALTYARALAMNSHCQTQVRFDVQNGVQGWIVERLDNCQSGDYNPIYHPAGGCRDCFLCEDSKDYALCPEVEISADRSLYRFDRWGRALNTGASPEDGTIGLGDETIRIVGETGFAYRP